MTNQAYPSVNDFETSWADVSIALTPQDGSIIDAADFASFKWSRKVDVGVRRGTSGGRVMARTTGQGDQDASCECYRTSWMTKILPALVAKAPRRGNQARIALVAFDITVQHTPIGSPDIFTTKMKGCRYLGDSDDMKEGSDPDKIELTLNPIEVVNIMPDGTEVVLL